MGIFDRSSSTTQNVENTLNQPVNIQDTGLGVGGVGGDVTIFNTDQNAFDDATALAERAVNFAENAASDAARLSLEQSRTVADFGSGALAEVGDLSRVSQANVIDAARDFAGNLRNGIQDVTEQALSFVRDVTQSQQRSLGDTVTNLNAIAREQSKSTDERVAEVSAGAQKTVLYAVLAIAGAIAVYAMVKK